VPAYNVEQIVHPNVSVTRDTTIFFNLLCPCVTTVTQKQLDSDLVRQYFCNVSERAYVSVKTKEISNLVLLKTENECFKFLVIFLNLLAPELFFLILAHPVYKM
jgi:hypothetical protein